MKNVHVNTVGSDQNETGILSYDDITSIMDLLKHTDTSINQICKKYNVSINVVRMINNGNSRKFRRLGVKYPLRSYRHKHHYNRSL